MATNAAVPFQNIYGRAMPVFIDLPVQAGATQLIAKGEICWITDLDIENNPVVPAVADETGYIPVIANEAQEAGDPARKIQFVLPQPGDLFRFALNTATTVQNGDSLEVASSQTFKAGSSNVVATVFGVDEYLDSAGAGVSRTHVWLHFALVSAAGLNNFPGIGLPAQVNVLNGLGNTIADPGDGVAIPVTASGQISLDIADAAETNTVAAPAQAGLELLIMAEAVAGTGTRAITFTAQNIDGTNSVATFDAAGDYLRVISVQTGAATFEWRLVSQVGVALS